MDIIVAPCKPKLHIFTTEDARYHGRSMESIMFFNYPHLIAIAEHTERISPKYREQFRSDYGYVLSLLKVIRGRENNPQRAEHTPMHRHLVKLLLAGENRVAKVYCDCGQIATHVSILGNSSGFATQSVYFVCASDTCRNNIPTPIDKNALILPLRFSSICYFVYAGEQRQFAGTLKRAFFPNIRRITGKTLFEFFNA